MGSAGEQCKRSLGKMNPSLSFKLRSPSLNSLRLRRIFDVFDRNHDGMISLDELNQALNLLGLETERSELESTVYNYIKPGNSGLRFEDFEALHRSLNDVFFGSSDDQFVPAAAEEDEFDLTEAFKVFDENGDGYISARELQVVLAKLGLQEGAEFERVEMMIDSVDQNQDGRVDFVEFKDMMRNFTLPTPQS